MCGIVGTLRFGADAPPAEVALLGAMRERMAHRGPDGEGLWISPCGRAGLAHRRLAIIDLDRRADQPMRSSDGRWTIVFNGEIYNHRELRRELSSAGVSDWRTDHSDTEVLLNAWRHWGRDCLDRLHGMFAFALWDDEERVLWVARDRIGVKPFYYAVLADRVNFASEIKALLVDPAQPRAMDEESLFQYLGFMAVPAPRTLFEGVRKLPGGCWARFDADGRVEQGRWWDAFDAAADAGSGGDGDGDDVAILREKITEAVRWRAVSDVDVGVFLSGGVDSSLNAALFARERETAIKTFTIGYRGDNRAYRNELAPARQVADFVGATHHERLLDVDDLVSFLPRMVELQDEPIGDPVCVPLYYVSEHARRNGVTVAQVGEGADELFYGYPRWHHVIGLHRALDLAPRAAAAAALAGLGALGRGDGYLAETIRRRQRGEPPFWSGAECFTSAQIAAVLSPRMCERFAGRSPFEALAGIRRRFEKASPHRDLPTWMTYVDLNFRLPELLLMRVDKMSMGASLECRVPFLDHRLVSWVLSLPTPRRLQLLRNKLLLRRAAAGLVPEAILARRKQGFGVPVADWLDGPLRGVLSDEVRAFLRASDVFRADAVEALLGAGAGNHLWWLWNLAAWHRVFIRESHAT